MKNTLREIGCAALALGMVGTAVMVGDGVLSATPDSLAGNFTTLATAQADLADLGPNVAPAAIELSRTGAPVASRSVGRIPAETRPEQREVLAADLQDPFEDIDLRVWPTQVVFGSLNRDLEQATTTEFARAEPIYLDLRFEVDEDVWVRVADTEYWLPMTHLSLTVPPPPAVAPAATALNLTPGSNRYLGRQLAAQRGWTGEQWYALERLFTRESGWNHLAANPVSTARGIPQKMMSIHYGANWRTSPGAAAWLNDPAAQINWGLDYIARRYTNPVGAWRFFLRNGWY